MASVTRNINDFGTVFSSFSYCVKLAEGVEAKEQSHLLNLLQCDEMQGFLFSKPMPCEVFETKFLIPTPGGNV